jgi:hypothetical protein
MHQCQLVLAGVQVQELGTFGIGTTMPQCVGHSGGPILWILNPRPDPAGNSTHFLSLGRARICGAIYDECIKHLVADKPDRQEKSPQGGKAELDRFDEALPVMMKCHRRLRPEAARRCNEARPIPIQCGRERIGVCCPAGSPRGGDGSYGRPSARNISESGTAGPSCRITVIP